MCAIEIHSKMRAFVRSAKILHVLLDDEARDASETRLDSLTLKEGSGFGYIFDFGDDWEHSVVVTGIEETTIKKMEPKVIKKTGKAPPQYGSLW